MSKGKTPSQTPGVEGLAGAAAAASHHCTTGPVHARPCGAGRLTSFITGGHSTQGKPAARRTTNPPCMAKDAAQGSYIDDFLFFVFGKRQRQSPRLGRLPLLRYGWVVCFTYKDKGQGHCCSRPQPPLAFFKKRERGRQRPFEMLPTVLKPEEPPARFT